jgi:hypothetical protein
MITINDVKPGMIGLSGGKSFIQKAIEYFSRSPFSHSFVIIDGPEDKTSVLETSDTIIQVVPLERKLSEPDMVEIYEPIASKKAKHRALSASYQAYAGTWYGYMSYIWFIYRWLMRKFGKEPQHMWHCFNHGTICSELVSHYLFNLGGAHAKLLDGRDLNTLSPQEIYELIQQNPSLFRFVGELKPQTGE